MLIATGMVATAQTRVVYHISMDARNAWMYTPKYTEPIPEFHDNDHSIDISVEDKEVLNPVETEKYKYSITLSSKYEFPSYFLYDEEGNMYSVHTHNVYIVWSSKPLILKKYD